MAKCLHKKLINEHLLLEVLVDWKKNKNNALKMESYSRDSTSKSFEKKVLFSSNKDLWGRRVITITHFMGRKGKVTF